MQSQVPVDPWRTRGGSGWTATGTGLPPDRVEIALTLGRTGPWYLWVRLHTLSGSADAQYAGLRASDLRRFWHTDLGTWRWVGSVSGDASRLRFDALASGPQVLSIGPGEAGPRCDRIVLTTDPAFDPSSLP